MTQHSTLSLLKLFQSISAPHALSVQQEAVQHQWRRRLREAREREARQALLLHRLHNKVSSSRLYCPLQAAVINPLLTCPLCAGVGLQAKVPAPGAAAAD